MDFNSKNLNKTLKLSFIEKSVGGGDSKSSKHGKYLPGHVKSEGGTCTLLT